MTEKYPSLPIVKTVDDLIPMDHIESHKRVDFSLWPPSQIAEYIGDQGILHFQEKEYPEGVTDGNHVRVVIGKINGEMVAFEWTYPRARFVIVEPWMIDSTYARVQRNKQCSSRGLDPTWVYDQFKPHEGSKYDWLQGLGILLNWKWLQLSEERRMCSTGACFVSEKMFNRVLYPEIAQWRTPPCSVSNHPDEWTWVNCDYADDMLEVVLERRYSKLSYEPEHEARVLHSIS